jgi:putative endonuclease
VAKALSTWRVYILRCSDGTLYTGATKDPERRLQQHSAGLGARYTRSRLPVSLVYEERAKDRGSALRREAALKRLSRVEKLSLIAPPADVADGERTSGLKTKQSARRKWTVPPVYRAIVKKNERQPKGLYDVLICGHAVPAATDNTYRKARPCPECRLRVQDYANEHAADSQVATPSATRR